MYSPPNFASMWLPGSRPRSPSILVVEVAGEISLSVVC